jgi:hypothetical protein
VYYIFYGNSWRTSGKDVPVIDFTNRVSHSSYFSYVREYKDGQGRGPNSIYTAGAVYLDYTKGKSLKVADIKAIYDSVVGSLLPYNPLAIYVFLGDHEVQHTDAAGFIYNVNICGSHKPLQLTNGNWIYQVFAIEDSYPGIPDFIRGYCDHANPPKPNVRPQPGAMTSLISHFFSNIVGTLTNPKTGISNDFGYIDEITGNEGHKNCYLELGTQTTLGGIRWNLVLGDQKYTVQTMWDVTVEDCVLNNQGVARAGNEYKYAAIPTSTYLVDVATPTATNTRMITFQPHATAQVVATVTVPKKEEVVSAANSIQAPAIFFVALAMISLLILY